MKLLKYLFFVLIISCGSSSDDSPAPQPTNRNPGTFTISYANITQTEATLNWTSAIDPDGDLVNYNVTTSGGTNIANNFPQPTFTFNNLTFNSSYEGKVIAKDGNGGSSQSNYSFTTLEENTVAFNIPSNLISYYSNIIFYEDATKLKDELAAHVIGKHSNFLSYTDRHDYLYDADEDPNNTANVILIYSSESRDEREYESGLNPYPIQTFNTEHIYPRSLVGNTAEADLHHLRVCDKNVNSSRSNYPFTDGSGSYALINSNSWYPGDEWKGDVARIIMYLNIRYDESFIDVGNLELFLKWNVEDPISAFESQRNNIIENAQGNRNPFIDNPYLATLLWGSTTAENLWQ